MSTVAPSRFRAKTGFALLAAASACLLLLLCLVWINEQTRRTDDLQLEMVTRQQTLIREISAGGSDASRGLTPDFRMLSDYRAEFLENLELLRAGDTELRIDAVSPSLLKPLSVLAVHWQAIDRLLARISDSRRAFSRINQTRGSLKNSSSALDDLLSRASRPLFIDGRQQQARSPSVVVVSELRRQLTTLQKDVAETLHSGQPTVEIIDELSAVNDQFLAAAEVALASGKDATPGSVAMAFAEQEDHAQSQRLARALHNDINDILEEMPAIVRARRASAELASTAGETLTHAIDLERSLLESINTRWLNRRWEYGTAGIAMICLALAVVVFLRDAQRRRREAEAAKERQQSAILRLLDQITVLADGDLTVEFEVTADFTGAIADSINHTVATLRKLVGTITSTSVEVASAARQTQTTARAMNDASNAQARRIGDISLQMSKVSQAIQEISVDAIRLATSARDSVALARDGASTTGNVIGGMDKLRGRIRETAERIHRLTSHSAEVESIVEYVHDIADQTSTLALNASIQAANAGVQGRGFAVVADEVQRLAEHAARATRQIEQLMRSIQTDIQAARISMERSIREVDSGSTAAEEAGEALGRIESGSSGLATLIDEIAAAARQHSESTTKLANNMRSMKTVAEHTSGSAGRTAEEISLLNDLSCQLRKSVEGFRLPELGVMTTH